MNKDIHASRYTHAGDPFAGDPVKIDCGYRPNGVIRLFYGAPLATEPDSAKILAFSYPALAQGIARIENAKTDLTAILEDDLDRTDEAIQFAIETLQRTSINVAEVSQLGAIAERAKTEMRL